MSKLNQEFSKGYYNSYITSFSFNTMDMSITVIFSSILSFSCIRLFVTLWTAACKASLYITKPGATQVNIHRVGDAIQPALPLSSPSPPTFNLSQHQGLCQWVSSSHQVTKILKFQLQHQSSNEYSRLISFRMDWLDLLAVQGTLKSLLQHHS